VILCCWCVMERGMLCVCLGSARRNLVEVTSFFQIRKSLLEKYPIQMNE